MNRKFLLGCGCLVLILIGTIAAGIFFAAPRLYKKGTGWFNAQMADSGRRAAVEAAWKEPSLRPDASWFPPVVDGWTLGTSEDFTTLPELQLDRPGRRGKYRGEKQDVAVIVVPVSDLEVEGVMSRAVAALQTSHAGDSDRSNSGTSSANIRTTRSSSVVTTRTPRRMHAVFNGDDHTRMWWLKDWLFIFRTTGPEDPDAFAEKYLGAMSPGDLEKR